jgi:hypothetical protein
VEAGTDESLRRLGRGQSRADNVRALEIINRLGLHCCFNLLLFNPDSTLEDVADNVAFLEDHPINPMNFCRTEVYAGTPLEARLRSAGRLRGSHWGWDYEIADPRAQAAFEIAYAAFRERNWGEPGLHHRTMDVDYEAQGLGHFYGIDPARHRRTKEFVVAVNRSTCAGLREIVELLAKGVPDPATCRDFAADLAARLRAEEARLLGESDQLLAGIRAMAPARAGRGTRVGRVFRGAAAAAGLAAAAALGAGCKRGQGARTQTEPADQHGGVPDNSSTQVFEEAPQPLPQPPDAGGAPSPDIGEAPPADAGTGVEGDAEPPPPTQVSETAPEPVGDILGPSIGDEQQVPRVLAPSPTRAGGSGTMDGDAYTTALTRRQPAILAAYRSAVAAHPGLVGEAVYLVHISASGSVTVEVESAGESLRSAGLVDAVLSRLRTMNFAESPPRGGDSVLRQRFRFEITRER